VFDVRSFGAIGDGLTLDTAAIQAALEACRRAGGGEVYLPAGRYLCGTLDLPGGTLFNISHGATLLGSPRIADYTRDPRGRDGDQTGYHLLHIADTSRVTVCGGGTIDGQGPAYWDTPENPVPLMLPMVDGRPAWRNFRLAYSPTDQRPSPMLNIYKSEDIRVEDITLTNSAGWALNMMLSRRVRVRGVNILNPMDGPNTDGIDINACQDVLISDCKIENGDDSIVMFTLPNTGPCERITVTNCILSTRCCAVKWYTGCGYPMRHFNFSNITVHNSERALGIYLSNGAQLEDLLATNFVVQGGTTPPNFSERPIHIDIMDPANADGIHNTGRKEFARAEIGSLNGVTLANWIIRSTGRIIVGGQTGAPVQNLNLSNILLQVSGPQDLSRFTNPTPSTGQWNHTLPHIRTVPAHVAVHAVKGLRMSDVHVVNASANPLPGMHGLWLEKTQDARVERFDCYPLQPGFEEIKTLA
jgi:polygalacturonase